MTEPTKEEIQEWLSRIVKNAEAITETDEEYQEYLSRLASGDTHIYPSAPAGSLDARYCEAWLKQNPLSSRMPNLVRLRGGIADEPTKEEAEQRQKEPSRLRRMCGAVLRVFGHDKG